jgi:hypothetical protein
MFEQLCEGAVKNRELITNALDLVSFLLVTPELLRIARPVVSTALRTLVGVSMGVVFVCCFYLIFADVPPFRETAISVGLHGGVLWNIGFFALLLVGVLGLLGFILGRFSDWFVSHLLALGVFLYFVSRMISFTVALQTSGHMSLCS